MSITLVDLPDEAVSNFTLPAGTTVWLMSAEYTLASPMTVNIEARGATNYDNQRRATDADGNHLFWVRGLFQRAPAAAAPTEPTKASADLSVTAAGALTSCDQISRD